jgi:restriction endonuclease S subunit
MKPARLGDAVVSMKNGMYKPASEYGDDGVPCLRMYNIDAGAIVWRDIKRMRVTADELEDYGLREGDLLVNRVNSRELVGKTACIPASLEPSVFESKNIRVRVDRTKALPKFIGYQLLAGGRKHFEGNAQQVVGMASISQKQIANFPIVLTELDDQHRIVAEIEKQFSRLDEAVAGLQRAKVNLKRYKAAVLKSAVTGRLVPTEADLARREGRNYETGAQLLQRILETRRNQWQGKGKYKEPAAPDTTDLPELPEGWVWATLPQLGELGRGKSKHRPRDDAKLYGGPYPFIQTGDVRRSDGSISEHTQSYSEFGLTQSRLWPAGTLCITIAANIAETGILTFESCFPDSIVGFISAMAPVTTRYAEVFIRTSKENLERFAPATAQKNINLEVLEAVAVALPPLPEQHRIIAEVDRLLSIAREAEADVDANLKRAQGLRQAILSKMFQPDEDKQ